MSRSVVEYFKLIGSSLSLTTQLQKFRLLRCRIINGGQEYETYEWMNSDLWKELIEGTNALLGACDTMNKNCSVFDPVVSTTSNLKLAFIIKDNVFKRPIYMQPSTRTGLFQLLSSLESQFVISVSLNKSDVKLQDLHVALSQDQRGEGQLKISSYFMQSVSLSEPTDM